MSNNIIVQNKFYPSGLREHDVLHHYAKYKHQILKEVRNRPLTLVIATDINKHVFRRNIQGRPIYLNKSNYDKILNGRIISIFAELGSPTNIWCIDIDIPHNTKINDTDIRTAIEDMIKVYENIYENGYMRTAKDIRITSTSTGYHIFGKMKRRDSSLNNKLNLEHFLKNIPNHYVLNGNKYKDRDIIIDTSIMRHRGSYVVPYGLNRNGLMCVDVTNTWKQFNKINAIIPTGVQL
jgi:hypothetical protein